MSILKKSHLLEIYTEIITDKIIYVLYLLQNNSVAAVEMKQDQPWLTLYWQTAEAG